MVQHDSPTRRGLIIGLAASAAGCDLFTKNYTLQYRITIRMVVGGRRYEGASVMKSVYTGDFTRAWAEAIVVDLGERGVLLGLLGSVAGVEGPSFNPKGDFDVVQLLPAELLDPGDITGGRAYEKAQGLRGPLSLSPLRWPVLIHLLDRANPASARLVTSTGQNYRVAPRMISGSAQRWFGIGARVDAVTLDMTDAPLTRQVEQVLPWVRSLPGARPGLSIMGPPGQSSLDRQFAYRHFKMVGYHE
jgi:hypothetical protein